MLLSEFLLDPADKRNKGNHVQTSANQSINLLIIKEWTTVNYVNYVIIYMRVTYNSSKCHHTFSPLILHRETISFTTVNTKRWTETILWWWASLFLLFQFQGLKGTLNWGNASYTTFHQNFSRGLIIFSGWQYCRGMHINNVFFLYIEPRHLFNTVTVV